MPTMKPMARAPMRLLLLLLSGYALCLHNATAARVSLYMSEARDVLNRNWDSSSDNLAKQLQELGFDLEIASNGQPDLLAGGKSPNAYVIPFQNGPASYSSMEDLDAVSSYLSSGGLVIVLDSNTNGVEEIRRFVAKSLRYQGVWSACQRTSIGAQSAGGLALASDAQSFLPASKRAWPERLEEARITTTMSNCLHQDASARSTPLFALEGEESRLVAQAFGKVGVPGAIVWLGYSWSDGLKPGWGALLSKLVLDFTEGVYVAPSRIEDDSELDSSLRSAGDLDNLLVATTDAAGAAEEIVRRFLQTSVGTYPPPRSPSPPLVPQADPSPSLRSPPPPKPRRTPPPPPAKAAAYFENVNAMGTVGKSRALVWYDDVDFRDELESKSPLQLIYRRKASCNVRCGSCNRAWKAERGKEQLALFFKDPVQISGITITQIKNPNVVMVQLLNWNGYPTGSYSAADIGATLYNVTSNRIPCGAELQIDVPVRVSGINQNPPATADPANLPSSLRASQGVLITVIRPAGAGLGYGPYVEYVKFYGRALYARDPKEYLFAA